MSLSTAPAAQPTPKYGPTDDSTRVDCPLARLEVGRTGEERTDDAPTVEVVIQASKYSGSDAPTVEAPLVAPRPERKPPPEPAPVTVAAPAPLALPTLLPPLSWCNAGLGAWPSRLRGLRRRAGAITILPRSALPARATPAPTPPAPEPEPAPAPEPAPSASASAPEAPPPPPPTDTEPKQAALPTLAAAPRSRSMTGFVVLALVCGTLLAIVGGVARERWASMAARAAANGEARAEVGKSTPAPPVPAPVEPLPLASSVPPSPLPPAPVVPAAAAAPEVPVAPAGTAAPAIKRAPKPLPPRLPRRTAQR
jgi:flagellar protein FliO/FliZ